MFDFLKSDFEFDFSISLCWDRDCNTCAQLCYIRYRNVDNHIDGRLKRKTLLIWINIFLFDLIIDMIIFQFDGLIQYFRQTIVYLLLL